VFSTTCRKTLKDKGFASLRTAHVSLALRAVAAVPAKTANKPLINIRALMPYAEHLTHPAYFVASHTVLCATGLPGTDYEPRKFTVLDGIS
jgi:hypothetical protein